MREKLIDIIGSTHYGTNPDTTIGKNFQHRFIELIADHLIANGATVQQWIPVSERLPEYEEPVMGWDAELRDMGIENFVYGKFLDIIDMSETNVTHWMPLPQPPKEGE